MSKTEKTLRIDETREGYIAYCRGSSSPFSFLAGKRKLSAGRAGDNYMFVTAAPTGQYMLQLIWPDLDQSVAGLGGKDDLDILASYCGWEMDYQEKALHKRLVPDSLGVLKLPTGRPFITWYSESTDDTTGPPLEGGQGGGDQSPGTLAATPYSGFACMRNDRELITFSLHGLGHGWTPESLRIKAIRVAFSTFFE